MVLAHDHATAWRASCPFTEPGKVTAVGAAGTIPAGFSAAAFINHVVP